MSLPERAALPRLCTVNLLEECRGKQPHRPGTKGPVMVVETSTPFTPVP
jgi:hypothetical protein